MEVLLFGCGHSRERRLTLQGVGKFTRLIPAPDNTWPPLTKVHAWDVNPDCVPTRLIDLNTTYKRWFFDSFTQETFEQSKYLHAFDEIHAYEVLEHLGEQGHIPQFFNTFIGIWHLLKPGGVLFASVPHWQSEWAWGDPSHRRVITPGSLQFLCKAEYAKQLGKTPMSDFRSDLGPANFEIVNVATPPGAPSVLYFALRAIAS